MLKEVIGVMVATAALAGCAETKLVLKEGKGVDGMGNGVPEVSAVTTGSVALYSVKNLHERTNVAIDEACNPLRINYLKNLEDKVIHIVTTVLDEAIRLGMYTPYRTFIIRPLVSKEKDKALFEIKQVVSGKLKGVAGDTKGAAAEVSDLIKTVRGWFPEHSVTYARKCFPDFNSTEAGD